MLVVVGSSPGLGEGGLDRSDRLDSFLLSVENVEMVGVGILFSNENLAGAGESNITGLCSFVVIFYYKKRERGKLDRFYFLFTAPLFIYYKPLSSFQP